MTLPGFKGGETWEGKEDERQISQNMKTEHLECYCNIFSIYSFHVYFVL